MEGRDWSWEKDWTPEQKAKATLLDVKKILPAVITGVFISVSTQILLDFIRPRLGIGRKAK